MEDEFAGPGVADPRGECEHSTTDIDVEIMTQERCIGCLTAPCEVCEDTQENWVCLKCCRVFCSRYINAHAAAHAVESEHPCALSMSDLMVWCYKCDDYISTTPAGAIINRFHIAKFDEPSPIWDGVEDVIANATFNTPTTAAADESSSSDDDGEAVPTPTEVKVRPAPLPTGVYYEESMLKHEIMYGSHPEQPARISSIFNLLTAEGLVTDTVRIPERLATDEEICRVHDSKLMAYVDSTGEMEALKLSEAARRFNSIYINPHSAHAARVSCGGVVEACMRVVSGELANAFAVVRPPGHHAECSKAMGFCFYNNVAVAAAAVVAQTECERVLILDWDVHHGNGTQHMFESDPSVLYMSLHRYDNGRFYPASEDANYDRVGEGEGKYRNVNVAWNTRHMGDAEYIAAFNQAIMPMAYEYDPDLVIISAGFDAAEGDPLGGYHISPEAYGVMTHMLCGLADGRVVIALEGGYNLTSISNSAVECMRVLRGERPARLPRLDVKETALEDIANTIRAHAPGWSCFEWIEPEPAEDFVGDVNKDAKPTAAEIATADKPKNSESAPASATETVTVSVGDNNTD